MANLITPSEAAELILARRKARASMVEYVKYLDLGFVPAKHHELMCAKLDAVERGEIDRLMLFLPPGSGKSKYGSELFPAYYLGKNPTKSIIACSHTQPLADRFGRRVRNLFMQPEHNALFGIGLASDSKAASYWSTERDGEYFAAGVGVAISGRRADIGLIDDPVKNREDADSITSQERVWDWYINDFYPRLKPNASQIIISTRWHERDLSGRVIEREGSRWDIVEIPFLARENDLLEREINERLWPEWFTQDQVDTAQLDARSFSALYQQRPVSDEGEYFKLNWFSEYDQIPENAHRYGASDYAVTEGHGDFTEHGIFALDSFGNLYIEDWWRKQATSDVWIEAQCDLIQEYEPLRWFGESGPIRRSVEPYLALRMTERNAGCYIEWLPSLHDKATRCRSFQALASRGKVFLPHNASWKAELLTQLTHFPAGHHDDGVDVCSLLGRGLDQVAAPRMKKWNRNENLTTREPSEHGWMVS
jgi:predicted phage terminase large subunit-like protein